MTAQHSTAQHSTAQHSTAQHSTAQRKFCLILHHFTVILFNFVALSLSGQTPTVRVCSKGTSGFDTYYNINGLEAEDTRLKLDNPTYFGAAGTFCDYNFTYIGMPNNTPITEAALNISGCHIYWNGWESNTYYSAAELTEIQSWLDNGGKIIAAGDDQNHSPIVSMLGLTAIDGGNSGGTSSRVSNNAISQDCFSEVSLNNAAVLNAHNISGFDNADVLGAITVLVQDQLTTPADTFPSMVLFPPYGFVMTDINMITNDGTPGLTSGPNLNNPNDTLLANLMCALASTCNGLPVDFTYFEAEQTAQHQVMLRWQTAMEDNNEGFVIERSAHGKQFEAIGFEAGQGNSHRLNAYSYVDDIPNLSGSICYRLKQMDYNGQFEYSNVVCINRQASSTNRLSVNPNPVQGKLYVSFKEASTPYQVDIIRSDGTVLLETFVAANQPEIELNLSHLPIGIYLIKATSQNGAISIQRIVIQ